MVIFLFEEIATPHIPSLDSCGVEVWIIFFFICLVPFPTFDRLSATCFIQLFQDKKITLNFHTGQ